MQAMGLNVNSVLALSDLSGKASPCNQYVWIITWHQNHSDQSVINNPAHAEAELDGANIRTAHLGLLKVKVTGELPAAASAWSAEGPLGAPLEDVTTGAVILLGRGSAFSSVFGSGSG